MELAETHESGVLILSPRGRVDSATSKAFEEGLLGRIAGGQTRIVVDFAELDYISSAGLRVLLMAAKRMKAAQGRFAICAMKDHIREVFEVSGFATILSILPDRPAALDSMAG